MNSWARLLCTCCVLSIFIPNNVFGSAVEGTSSTPRSRHPSCFLQASRLNLKCFTNPCHRGTTSFQTKTSWQTSLKAQYTLSVARCYLPAHLPADLPSCSNFNAAKQTAWGDLQGDRSPHTSVTWDTTEQSDLLGYDISVSKVCGQLWLAWLKNISHHVTWFAVWTHKIKTCVLVWN